jgi:hypothetical protein
MYKNLFYIIFIVLFTTAGAFAQSKLLIPMDVKQTNDLKAYGIAYWSLEHQVPVDWLLNYRGGSFMIDYSDQLANECRVRGVMYEQLDGGSAAQVYALVQSDDNNMDVVRLEKTPKMAVYVPPDFKPWDDAVTLALDYAEIPYDKVWDDEVLGGKLSKYDWLHLFHEDFTGQYGKFYAAYGTAPWYIQEVATYEAEAHKLGFKKVSEEKKSVARAIKEYIANGGFMFAMCSATDSYDIALAAENDDICDAIFDGDPMDPNAQAKLDFSKTLAFQNFTIVKDPYVYEYSDIDIQPEEIGPKENDYFTLFDFSAKYDPVPAMLTQDQVNVVKGFMGQTTGFHKRFIKPSVMILGEREGTDQVKYIHGNFGKGTWTFLGGHDPEQYQHMVFSQSTDLDLHRDSPGYRLILNNVLFPAAKKKHLKT